MGTLDHGERSITQYFNKWSPNPPLKSMVPFPSTPQRNQTPKKNLLPQIRPNPSQMTIFRTRKAKNIRVIAEQRKYFTKNGPEVSKFLNDKLRTTVDRLSTQDFAVEQYRKHLVR